MGKVFWCVITLAVLLRIVLMPITYHSDIRALDFSGYVIKEGVGVGLYDYLPKQDPDGQIRQAFPSNLFNYPPLVYFFVGGFDNVTTFITPVEVREKFIYQVGESFGDWRIGMHLFLLKLVYIPFDIGVALILWKMMVGNKKRVLVLVCWLLNPVVLFGVYMMGQFDIIPAFFSVLAIFIVNQRFRHRNGVWLAAIVLGLGACFKIYPLLLLPVIASLEMSWLKRVGVVVTGLSIYLVSISPFLLSSGFRANALVAGQTTKSLYSQIPLSGGESIMLYLATMVFIYLIFFAKTAKIENLWSRSMLVLLIFFMFTHFHPQWLVWVMPFLVLEIGYSGFKYWLADLILISTWFGSLWFFDPGMTFGLFVPILPWLYDNASIWQLMGLNIDYHYIRSLLSSVFFGAALFLVLVYLPKPKFEEIKNV